MQQLLVSIGVYNICDMGIIIGIHNTILYSGNYTGFVDPPINNNFVYYNNEIVTFNGENVTYILN